MDAKELRTKSAAELTDELNGWAKEGNFAIRAQFLPRPPWFSWHSRILRSRQIEADELRPQPSHSTYTSIPKARHLMLNAKSSGSSTLYCCWCKAFFFIYTCRSPYHRPIHDGPLSPRIWTHRPRGIDQHTSLSFTEGSSERLLPPFRTPNRYCRSEALYRRRSP